MNKDELKEAMMEVLNDINDPVPYQNRMIDNDVGSKVNLNSYSSLF